MQDRPSKLPCNRRSLTGRPLWAVDAVAEALLTLLLKHPTARNETCSHIASGRTMSQVRSKSSNCTKRRTGDIARNILPGTSLRLCCMHSPSSPISILVPHLSVVRFQIVHLRNIQAPNVSLTQSRAVELSSGENRAYLSEVVRRKQYGGTSSRRV